MGDFLGSGCPPWVMARAISLGLADFRGSCNDCNNDLYKNTSFCKHTAYELMYDLIVSCELSVSCM